MTQSKQVKKKREFLRPPQSAFRKLTLKEIKRAVANVKAQRQKAS